MSAQSERPAPRRTISVNDVRYVVGDCISDGTGGCKRAQAAGISCCNSAAPQNFSLAPCCKDDDDDDDEEDACCSNCDDESEAAPRDKCCSPAKAEIQVPFVGNSPKSTNACAKACCSKPASLLNEEPTAESCCSDCDEDDPAATQIANAPDNASALPARGCCSDRSPEPVTVEHTNNPRVDLGSDAEDACCSDCGGSETDDAPSVGQTSLPDSGKPIGGCCATCTPEPGPAVREVEEDCCSDCSDKDDAPSSDREPARDEKPIGGCCFNCTPKVAAPADITPGDNNVSADDCCSDCDSAQRAPDDKSDKACCSNGDDAASADADKKASDACCSNCSGDNDLTATVIPVQAEVAVASAVKGKECCASQTVRRRRAPKKAGPARGAPTSARGCPAETTMGRFYEIACCCLVNWARARQLATRKRRHPSPSTSEAVEPRAAEEKPSTSRHADPELGLGAGRRRTMAMAISGMDCPQCTSKVTRALDTIASVCDAKVNFFTARATLAYTDGVAVPAEIAKRTSELTGFACSVLDEVLPDSELTLMRIRLPTGAAKEWEKGTLPPGVTVKSSQANAEGVVLDVEYNTLVVLPRQVLAAFAEWGGEFVQIPKIRVGTQAAKELNVLFLRTVISALLCIPVLVFSWAPLPEHPVAYGGTSLALATAIQLYAAAPLYPAALRSLFLQHMLDMDLLVVLGTSIAYVFSVVSYLLLVAGRAFSDPLFETSALLITLITLGRLISAYARRRATSALDELYDLQVDTVELVSASSDTVKTIPAELVHPGDVLHIAPGAVVPTDGAVVSGTGHVDESSITGESMPVDKAPGARLTAGTTNGESALRMRVDRLPADSTVAEIGALMLDVQNQRIPVQDLADRVAGWLAPVILVVSVVTFVVWLVIGLRVRNQGATDASVAALRYAVAVMVVSCPCALVLCVPMVVVITTAVASKAGILFKSAEAVQVTRNVEVVVFDKTGTLTTGTLAVCKSHIAAEEHVGVILGLVAGSSHPVSRAVFGHVTAQYPSIASVQLQNTTSLPGQGLEASLKTTIIRGGNPVWLDLEAHPEVQQLQHEALTIFAVTIGGTPVAVFGLADTMRPDARDTVDMLLTAGAEVFIVSGDSQPVVYALATKLNIPPSRAFGACLPTDKLEHVRSLQQSRGAGTRTVMFVGDGTNDALALAQANVGVSFSAGTAVAASAAHVLLLNAHLRGAIAAMFALSRGAVRRVYINFAWAFLYNLLAVLGAAGALVRVRIAPEYAGLGEMVSVVPVVLVAWSMWLLKQ